MAYSRHGTTLVNLNCYALKKTVSWRASTPVLSCINCGELEPIVTRTPSWGFMLLIFLVRPPHTDRPMVHNPLKIDVLDIDLLVMHVCPHLSAQEIEVLHQVSVDFRAAIKDEDYGKELFAQHWNDISQIFGDGATKEYSLKDGKKEGQCKSWYSCHKLWIICNYKNGYLNGPYAEWYRTGEPWLECIYKDGKKDGPYKEWYQNGQPCGECTYKDGKPDGLYREWGETGQLRIVRHYVNGEKDVPDLNSFWSTVKC